MNENVNREQLKAMLEKAAIANDIADDLDRFLHWWQIHRSAKRHKYLAPFEIRINKDIKAFKKRLALEDSRSYKTRWLMENKPTE